MAVRRSLENHIIARLQRTPILIIEGARSVGKTHLLTRLEQRGIIVTRVSLTDPAMLRAAQESPLSWLRGLPQPFAIDEAQLAPGLPLALKALLDERSDQVSAVLTGSAEIGRTSLGGSDPLARRSRRVTLEPLTESEIAGETGWNAVDALFDADPAIGAASSPVAWQDQVARGGLPHYRLSDPGRAIRSLQSDIRDDLDAVLTASVLPGERHDLRLARRVLDYALRNPASEVKAKTIANALELDARTVNNYLDIAEKRFLLREIYNLRPPAKQAKRTTAKFYPSDPALAAALLSSGSSLDELDDRIRGGLLEAHVAQQLRAHLGWAATETGLHHWREHSKGRTDEVDLVLQDEKGRLIGLEVKSRGAPRASDLRGLLRLREAYPNHFHRGFVVSLDGAPSPAEEGGAIWRIPLAALTTSALWRTPSLQGRTHRTQATPDLGGQYMPTAEAQIFMSYAHRDQESAVGGDLRRFAGDVVEALEGLFGVTAQLFIDTQDGQWGESLWNRLEKELSSSTYLLPFITPRYLSSTGCRREFNRFTEATQRQTSHQRTLPLMWIEPPASLQEDAVYQSVKALRFIDATAARTNENSSGAYRSIVESTATELHKVIEANETIPPNPDLKISPDSEDPADRPLVDLLEDIESKTPPLLAAIAEFGAAMNDFGDSFIQSITPTPAGGAAELQSALEEAETMLAEPGAALESTAQLASSRWSELFSDVNAAVRQSRALGQPMDEYLIDTVHGIAREMHETPTAELEAIAQQMPLLSARLAPTSRSLLAAIRTVKTIGSSAQDFIDAHSGE